MRNHVRQNCFVRKPQISQTGQRCSAVPTGIAVSTKPMGLHELLMPFPSKPLRPTADRLVIHMPTQHPSSGDVGIHVWFMSS